MKTVEQAALEEGVTPRRIRSLIASGRIAGAQKFAGVWTLPDDYKITPAPRSEFYRRHAKISMVPA